MVTARDLNKLRNLAVMIKDLELARLGALAEARRRAEAEFTRTRDAQTAVWAQAAPDPAHLSGADQRWQAWSTARLQALSVETASAAALLETQTIVARQALGRAEALSRLAARRAAKRKSISHSF